MRKLYGSHNTILVGHLKTVLEQHGVACVVRNEHLGGAAGELPPIECWPEIWITEDAHYARAREILDSLLDPGEQAAWTCPGCSEWIEGQFTACWRCGADRPVQGEG